MALDKLRTRLIDGGLKTVRDQFAAQRTSRECEKIYEILRSIR